MSLRVLAAIALVAASAISASGCAATPSATQLVVAVPADAATLEEALEAVSPGGMILLSPGVYTEQLVIDKVDVTIRGLDRNTTIVDGELKRPFGIVGIADGVRIENLTVRNTTFYGVLVTGLHDENGPSAHNSEGYTRLDPEKFPPLQRFSISHVTASNNGLYGIYAFNAQHGVITDSYASGSADSGFYVGQCPDCDILVTGNVAENNAVGFENANASNSLSVVGNRFSNNRVGVTLISNYQEAFTPESSTLVAGNVISANTSADSPAQESGGFGIGLGISGGRDNLILNNLIEGNPRAGILLENTEDLPATGNTFDGNSFVANGIDVADVSAARTPPSHNCAAGASAPTTLPLGYLGLCDGATQPSAPPADLPGPAAPRGISFAKVPLPIDQPNMANVTATPERLPSTVTHPALSSIAVPSADLLIERTRR